ncbi:helix-turn-helix domain-containing protein [Lacticaseibacillus absianus]|uniref:helix-turn-helix domain-containing protein n=1 Tax=Lacticaseibacillus absianus TaxID=2729623 RepID=UPI0015CDB2C2|nr:helix-turn-helix domain-containing protein [Lacticaseibacillus absianus]
MRTKQRDLPVTTQVQQTRAHTGAVEDVNLRRIAMLMDRNYGTLYYTYNQLLDELREIVGDPDADIPKLFSISVGQLRMAMVQKSVPFAFLQHLINEDQPNFEAFVDSVEASRVTCLRYLRPVRDLAKQLGVRIVYEKMRISGDENRIRIFLTLVYWLATDGAVWPFTHFTHRDALEMVHRITAAFDLDYTSPVIREVLGYHVTINQTRIAHGHTLTQPVDTLSYPVPNLFDNDVRLTQAEQFSESQHLYQLNFLLPIYYAPGDPNIPQVLATFKRYNPALYQFIERFMRQLPEEILDVHRLSEPMGELIQASLLAIVMSVLTFGFDLGAVIAYAFNHRVIAARPDDRLAIAVRQTAEAVLVKEDPREVQALMPALSQALYANLLQVRRFAQPAAKVKVALMLEPVTLGFIDLVTFIDQQPFVELLHDHFESADLVIKDSSMPLDFGEHQPLIFKWNMNASSDLFGQLFGLLHALQQEKTSL